MLVVKEWAPPWSRGCARGGESGEAAFGRSRTGAEDWAREKEGEAHGGSPGLLEDKGARAEEGRAAARQGQRVEGLGRHSALVRRRAEERGEATRDEGNAPEAAQRGEQIGAGNAGQGEAELGLTGSGVSQLVAGAKSVHEAR